jgi:phytoene synthase
MAHSLENSYTYCERLARRAARNFYYGFRLLPRPKRLALCALYAYMRRVDDLADTPGEVETKRRLLAEWRRRTERAIAGHRDDEPLWPALADTLEKYLIPPRYLLDVVAGAEMDLESCDYRTFGDLRRYCYHVAGAVGLVCVHVFGFSDPRAKELAEEMGIAFQLTNILRDLGQDYRMGRVYLPREDFERFGCRPEEFARQTAPQGALAEMLRFEARRAWEFYERAWTLVPLVGEDSRRALWALARIYSGVLEEVERRGFDVFSSRARLRAAEKIAILFWARLGPAGAYEFKQRDRSWRGLGWALLRHRAR